jgi:hypothetical protein
MIAEAHEVVHANVALTFELKLHLTSRMLTSSPVNGSTSSIDVNSSIRKAASRELPHPTHPILYHQFHTPKHKTTNPHHSKPQQCSSPPSAAPSSPPAHAHPSWDPAGLSRKHPSDSPAKTRKTKTPSSPSQTSTANPGPTTPPPP